MRAFLSSTILFLSGSLVFAQSVAEYGMGSDATARVGSLTAEASVWSSFFNPALLPRVVSQQMALSTSVGRVSFSPFSNVRIEGGRYRTLGSGERIGDYQMPAATLEHWALSWAYPFSLSPVARRRAGIGFCLSGPFTRLRRLVAEAPDSFQPLRYGPQDQQFRAMVSAGVELVPQHLYLGAGLSFFLSAVGTGEAVLLSENPSGRLEMEISLNSHATLGLYGKLKHNSWGLVFRQGISPTVTEKLTGRVELGDGLQSMDMPFLMQATLYGEPHRFELDWQYSWDKGSVSAGVTYDLWENFSPPFLRVHSVLRGGEKIETVIPHLELTNTLNPRVSFFTRIAGVFKLMAGYRFQPTPVSDAALRGSANLLDSATHVTGLGLSYLFEGRAEVGIFGQLRFMHSRDIHKDDVRDRGAPGYSFGASGYYLGIGVSTPL